MDGRDETYWLKATITTLEAQVGGLECELPVREIRLEEKDRRIAELEQQVAELKTQAPAVSSPPPPPFVKPNLPRRRRRRRRPGRAGGHEAALRPMPRTVDHHQDVPLGKDDAGRPVCPRCRCRLTGLRRHRRIVEDLVRGAVETTAYHTRSGHCPHCGTRVESRAAGQPPAANVPHGQLGINALTTAAILRVRHRLPFRRVAQLLTDLPGLRVSAAAAVIVKQVKRLARWLDGRYRDLVCRMRASPHVHADETGWRVDGRNGWLWAFTDPTSTLHHVDESRAAGGSR
jgi:hypothetical protein